jgi:DNA processing protein
VAVGGAVVAWSDEHYPPALRDLSDPPLCLFVRAGCGRQELEGRLVLTGKATAVAVVGTRGPSPYGAEMARLLGRDLILRGLLVVSGLATGVDAAAHRGALDAGSQAEVATVAVLGCGADVVYPRVNRPLYDEVLRRGLVVSEFAWGVPARAWRFPARNRIMAALGRAVVIVEGAERSGARLTVDYALDLGREVLAVPGEAGRRLTAAPHAFLRLGAGLCESAADVAAVLRIEAVEVTDRQSGAAVDGQARWEEAGIEYAAALPVLRALADACLSADQAAARCSLPVHEVAGLLSRLEVDGLVTLEPGGVYRLRRR